MNNKGFSRGSDGRRRRQSGSLLNTALEQALALLGG